MKRKKSYCFSNLAITLDGKIADADKDLISNMGSKEDRRWMQIYRDEADVVVFGSRTLEKMKRAARHSRKSKIKTQLVNAVITGNGNLDPKLPFWKERDVIRYVFTTQNAFLKVTELIQDRAFIVVAGQNTVDPRIVLRRLAESSLHYVLLEGGAETMRSFLDADALHELRVTLTPFLMGGLKNPTLVGGQDSFLKWKNLKLSSVKKLKSELFLSYKVI